MTVYDGRPAPRRSAARSRARRPVRRPARSGPDVDPATTWAGAALVTTSPSINPDYPTTEPRLRAALRALVAARAAATRPPRRSSREADLFLRLCPAPTIGVTGTKGKTTTASLTAAILAADPIHPVVLGGNIGIPLVERLPGADARPPGRHRAVRAAAADAVARHDGRGLHERHLGPPRPARVARGVPAGQAAARRARRPGRRARPQRRGPGRRGVRRPRDRAGRPLPRDGPLPGGLGVVDGWIVAAGVERLPLAGGGLAGDRAGRPDHAGRRARHPRRATTSRTRWPRSPSGLLFGVAPDAIRAAAAAFTGVEHRLEPVGRDRRRPLRQRLAGHPAGRRDRRAPGLRAADRADRRRPRQGRRPRRAGAGRRRAAARRGPDRRERPDPRGAVPRRRPRPHGARRRLSTRPSRAAAALAREALPDRPRGHGRDRAAQPGRRQLRHVRRLRRPRPGVQGRRRAPRRRAARAGDR